MGAIMLILPVGRYAMYHSLRAIVKEHYRPHEHGRELDARRSLTKSLNELEGWLFDDDEEE